MRRLTSAATLSLALPRARAHGIRLCLTRIRGRTLVGFHFKSMPEQPETPSGRAAQSHAAANPVFQTTHWSLVLQAAGGESSAALETLCQAYWYPLYAYVRRQGYDTHDA